MEGTEMDRFFTWFASKISFISGQPLAFVVAVGTIIVWGVTGPLFAFSDTWQLVINTGTTIVTFLMVFLIQNSTNRDAAAMQAKLDELLRAVDKARGEFIGIEHLSEKQVEEIRSALEKETSGRSGTKAPPNQTVEQLLRRF
jgi:low affinity Fe/Cu permease